MEANAKPLEGLSFSRKRPVLSYISQSGNAPLVSCLLDLGNWPHDEKDDKGRPPLSLAAENGYTNIVKLLLDSYTGNESDSRALSLTADNHHTDCDGPARLYSSYRAGDIRAGSSWTGTNDRIEWI